MSIAPRREAFLDEYIKRRCRNVKESAIAAGYSPRSAESQGYQILREPAVQKRLEVKLTELRKELRKEFMYDAVEARKEMYKIMLDPNARDADKISVAKDFLDRAGFKPVDQHDVMMEAVVVFEGMDEVED